MAIGGNKCRSRLGRYTEASLSPVAGKRLRKAKQSRSLCSNHQNECHHAASCVMTCTIWHHPQLTTSTLTEAILRHAATGAHINTIKGMIQRGEVRRKIMSLMVHILFVRCQHIICSPGRTQRQRAELPQSVASVLLHLGRRVAASRPAEAYETCFVRRVSLDQAAASRRARTIQRGCKAGVMMP